MATRRTRKAGSLAAQTIALGIAAPQVAAHRVARMAMAGASPSARDRKEFHRMGTEKMIALNEAWSAMAFEAFRPIKNWRFRTCSLSGFLGSAPNPPSHRRQDS
jgi:hypothetical protein